MIVAEISEETCMNYIQRIAFFYMLFLSAFLRLPFPYSD